MKTLGLAIGPVLAMRSGMKTLIAASISLLLFLPAGIMAAEQKPDTNVNSKYDVESVEISGVPQSKISQSLRDDINKLVGKKYDQEAANELAKRLRNQLSDYSITLKVKRGNEANQLRVVFLAERIWWKRFEVQAPDVVYHSKEGFSGALDIPIKFGPNVLSFGIASNSDNLLERYTGWRFSFENHKVGTDRLQVRLDFNTYHEDFNFATKRALESRPEIPELYRARQDFAPSVSVIPFRDLKFSLGASFVRLELSYPESRTATAYAGTAGLQYRHRISSPGGMRQDIKFDYAARASTSVLDSNYIYTRHFVTADYSLSKNKNLFGAHFMAGVLHGDAPLFERFTLGNSFALRGWNKFDVAPLGGTRLAYGSLEYRYHEFQLFYDVGAVWEREQNARVRHSLGFGLATRDGFFASLAFPVRLHNVTPLFMLGFRY
jgi:hypothetical protein